MVGSMWTGEHPLSNGLMEAVEAGWVLCRPALFPLVFGRALLPGLIGSIPFAEVLKTILET